jgi:hypothetical protein
MLSIKADYESHSRAAEGLARSLFSPRGAVGAFAGKDFLSVGGSDKPLIKSTAGARARVVKVVQESKKVAESGRLALLTEHLNTGVFGVAH